MLPKTGWNAMIPQSYSIISFLPVVGKIAERFMGTKIQELIDTLGIQQESISFPEQVTLIAVNVTTGRARGPWIQTQQSNTLIISVCSKILRHSIARWFDTRWHIKIPYQHHPLSGSFLKGRRLQEAAWGSSLAITVSHLHRRHLQIRLAQYAYDIAISTQSWGASLYGEGEEKIYSQRPPTEHTSRKLCNSKNNYNVMYS